MDKNISRIALIEEKKAKNKICPHMQLQFNASSYGLRTEYGYCKGNDCMAWIESIYDKECGQCSFNLKGTYQ